MIESPTVLVLGAGASAPFGFPTALGLYDYVIKWLGRAHGMPQLERIARKKMIPEAQIKDFLSALRQYPTYSVDAFLEVRQEFKTIGKLAMAQALVPKENEERFYDTEDARHGNWYARLFEAMVPHPRTNFESFADNDITILTFNYDRSLEQYLFNSVKVHFRQDAEKTAQMLARIKIIHLYGKLCPLPWQEGWWQGFPLPQDFLTDEHLECVKCRPYDTRYGQDNEHGDRFVEAAAEDIRIVSESDPQDDAFRVARKELERAACIYFLGFGYGKENLRRLSPDGEVWKMGKTYGGTVQGLGTVTKNRIKSTFAASFHFPNPGQHEIDICGFFDNYLDLG